MYWCSPDQLEFGSVSDLKEKGRPKYLGENLAEQL